MEVRGTAQDCVALDGGARVGHAPARTTVHARLRRTAAAAGCTALYVTAALLVTWPLARHLTSHLPLGGLDAPTVPWFNLWTLAWNADRLAHGLHGYWDAPIFYPARDTFALSEP